MLGDSVLAVRYHLVPSSRAVAPLCANRWFVVARCHAGSAYDAKFAAFEPRALSIDTFDSLAVCLVFRLGGSRDRRHM
jgi:hypothetical protein